MIYEAMIPARNKRRAIKRFKRTVEPIKVKDIEIDDVFYKKGNKIYWDRECLTGETEDTRWRAEMRYFEFNSTDFGYYALIGVDGSVQYPIDTALNAYEEIVADIEDKDMLPEEITKEEALEQYKHGEIEGSESDDEKVKEFEKSIKLADNEYFTLLLIDGDLC